MHSPAVLLEKKSASERKNDARAPLMFIMSCPHPRQPTVQVFNREASEGSSMKNPERFNAFVVAQKAETAENRQQQSLGAHERTCPRAAVPGPCQRAPTRSAAISGAARPISAKGSVLTETV
jgi:hypothetical protein